MYIYSANCIATRIYIYIYIQCKFTLKQYCKESLKELEQMSPQLQCREYPSAWEYCRMLQEHLIVPLMMLLQGTNTLLQDVTKTCWKSWNSYTLKWYSLYKMVSNILHSSQASIHKDKATSWRILEYQ